MAEVVSARLGEDLLDRLDAARGEASRGSWVTDLITRQLTAGPSSGSRSLGPGVPAPGVCCMWSGCWSRDSDRYGVTDPAELTRDYSDRPRDEHKAGIALCKAHAATLEGRTYRTPAAARMAQRQPETA